MSASLLHRLWLAIGTDRLDWCHTTQPDDTALLVAIRPAATDAGITPSDAELPAESYPPIAVSSARRLLEEGYVQATGPSGYVRLQVERLPLPPAQPTAAVVAPPRVTKSRRLVKPDSQQMSLFDV